MFVQLWAMPPSEKNVLYYFHNFATNSVNCSAISKKLPKISKDLGKQSGSTQTHHIHDECIADRWQFPLTNCIHRQLHASIPHPFLSKHVDDSASIHTPHISLVQYSCLLREYRYTSVNLILIHRQRDA